MRPPALAAAPTQANSLQGSGIYRMNDLPETAKERKQAATIKYRAGMHLRILTLAALSDDDSGGQTQESRCHLGFLIGLPASSLRGPCHVL